MRGLRRHDVLGPLIVVLVVYLGAIGVQLQRYDGDPTGFVQFGSEAAASVQPPAGAEVLADSIGYDGQFYYVLAMSPEIDRHVQTVFETFEYRAQRIAYPVLAWLLSGGGSQVGLPWVLLAVNVVFAVLATAAAAAWLRVHGRSGWLALAVGLTPGILMTILRDLTDVVGLAAALGALWAWSVRRERLTATALVVAVLARETMLILAAVLAYDCWRRRRRDEQAAHPALLVLPAVAAFVAWEAYATWRFDEIPWTTAPSSLWQAPGVGVAEALSVLVDQPASEVAWDLTYLFLCAAAVVAAIAALWRDRGPEALFCASQAAIVVLLGEVFWIDHWSFTRVTAPLFASLLLAGVTARSLPAVAVPCAAAGLTVLIPIALDTGATFELRDDAVRRVRTGTSPAALTQPAPADRGARSFNLCTHVAADQVVVHDAAGLHRGVYRGRAEKPEAAPLELLRERRGLGSDRRNVFPRPGGAATPAGSVRPNELRQRAIERRRRTGVRDGGLDLRPVANDARVGHEPLYIAGAEARNRLDLETGEAGAEGLALAHDRRP
jgi:hypothetical protein